MVKKWHICLMQKCIIRITLHVKIYGSAIRAIGAFFAQNDWILEEVKKYSSAESTGVKQAIKELHYLWHNDKKLIPKSILFSLIKFISYKVSLVYNQKLKNKGH